MRHLIYALLIICTIGLQANAQGYEQKVDSSIEKIRILFSNSHIRVSGNQGDLFRIKGTRAHKVPERAKGLKPLYQTLEDNTGIGFSAIEKDGVLILTRVVTREDGDYQITVPQNLDLEIIEQHWYGEQISVSDIKGSVTIKSNNSDIDLKNISGTLEIKSTSGDIEGSLSSLSRSAESKISSVSGTIDLAIPSNLGADLELKSISGKVFTDFDLKWENDRHNQGLRRIGGARESKGSINGGGARLALSSISDDIYLRKQK
ncbi:DUF4097 family beta strand repeat-containing protein [Fulvivirgaceae bacterium BMA10]|uniref:DUF4097 family beta strand repeat-containing protein n=1 Tax=Splendidivirga corallicola TaxID=3051826 RepID=A0ABT8KM26_9BACT|nr:DUF4097 family beta strand repeat-containing protein [Fulvivirgaceae bacterium BMA10]